MNNSIRLLLFLIFTATSALVAAPPGRRHDPPPPRRHHTPPPPRRHHYLPPPPPPVYHPHHHRRRDGLRTAADILSIVNSSLNIIETVSTPEQVQPVIIQQPVQQPTVITVPAAPEKPRPVSVTILPDGTRIEKY